MKLIAYVVFYAMDRLDAWTGHDFFACWNAGGETSGWRYQAHRLFLWAEERVNGPFEAAVTVICDECGWDVPVIDAFTATDGKGRFHRECLPDDAYVDENRYEAWA